MTKKTQKIIIALSLMCLVVFGYIYDVMSTRNFVIGNYKMLVENTRYYTDNYSYYVNLETLDVWYYDYKFNDNAFKEYMLKSLSENGWYIQENCKNSIRARKDGLGLGIFKKHDSEKGDYWYIIVLTVKDHK